MHSSSGPRFHGQQGESHSYGYADECSACSDHSKLEQTSGLPLGARVKLNPWNDHAELLKTAPAGFTAAREKLPLELTHSSRT